MPDYKTETSIIDSVGKEWAGIVYFDYQPYEPSEQPENAYPGCQAEISINSIYLGNGNLVELDSLDGGCITNVTQDCWEFVEKLDEQ